ncbi:MAG TPA: AAA family ATPase [Gaiellaceae bacterium]|nr:AAA family ATPase [Gaiellaceae bacterium]
MSERPLLVLIGGATGTGKSTVAAELAGRLGIETVTCTDSVRQRLRSSYPPEQMPSIHASSFEAGDVFPDADDPLAFGFLQQSRDVLHELRPALASGESLVLEGVHVVPGLVDAPDGAVVVQCVLAIPDEQEHERNFHARDAATERPRSRYLGRFREIRRLHELLVERARQEGVPVLANDDPERIADVLFELARKAKEAA